MENKTEEENSSKTKCQSYPYEILSAIYYVNENHRGVYINQSIKKQEYTSYKILLRCYEFHKMRVNNQISYNNSITKYEY